MTASDMGKEAKNASISLAALDGDAKNRAIAAIADALEANRGAIEAANQLDLAAATELPAPIQKRLAFQGEKISAVIQGLHSLQALPDPVGITQKATELADGLELFRVSCPIGVIGVIFESRPDALVQISSLCLKSGNAALLKGGSEAMHTNRALYQVIAKATEDAGAPKGWLQLLETRADVNEMLKMDDCLDLIIPRGSNAFVSYIMHNTSIPVMGHADGLCHLYVDKDADLDMACKLIVDAKTQYVSVCNAVETLLVSKDVAAEFLPRAAQALRAKNVRLLGCPRCQAIVPMEAATDQDWDTEYLDYVLSIRVVDDLAQAIDHINLHGSGHTDVIVTRNPAAAATFTRLVDSADVFWNCSSRFADGFRFGLGAEVGIATGKIHARGPVGLDGLCIYKWILCGHGDIVADFASGNRSFTHKNLAKTAQQPFA